MPPKYKLHITEGTLADYEVARAWWEVNRPKAPLALQEDFDDAMERLERLGDRGGVELLSPGQRGGYRRLLLPRVRYYLYFRVVDDAGAIEVLALWHVSRGTRPQV